MNPASIIVTGAANGIGKAITLRCIASGWRVIACDIDQTLLQALPDAVQAALPDIDSALYLQTHQLDVGDHAAGTALFAQLDAQAEMLTGLVNNAGIYLAKDILDYTPAEIERVLRVNCLGAIYFSQFFAQRLIAAQQPGAIVNISSIAGQEGGSDAIYSLSKAGLLGLTKSCAKNFAPFIRVNAVAPTVVKTQMMEQIPPWRLAEYRNGELLTDPILPEDVADTVIFLLSEQAKHYTGAVFDLNNGVYRR